MTVDQPAIAGLTLRHPALCSRRRVALLVVASALIAVLLLYAHQLSSLHAFGSQSKPHRWPVLVAGLSHGPEGNCAMSPKEAPHAAEATGKKLQAMVAIDRQTTAPITLSVSRSAGDGRGTTVPNADAATFPATARHSSAVGVTLHDWSTTRLVDDAVISLSVVAAAADAAPRRSTATMHTATLHDGRRLTSAEGGDHFETNAGDALTSALTSLVTHVTSYTASGTMLRDELAAATATAAAAVAVQTATTSPSSTSHLAATHPIVYVRFIDPLAGLGNKMFQYASGVGLALRYGAEARLVVDHTAISRLLSSMRSVFRMSTLLEQPNAPNHADVATLSESGWGRYNAAQFDKHSNFELRNTTVVGYLQSWRYFEPVAGHIRNEFALTSHAASLADDFLRRSDNGGKAAARGNGSSSLFVGVHVRRGDMVNRPTLYTVAPPEFLLKAIEYYVAKYGFHNQLTFVIATNDRDWVKNFVDTRLPKHIRVLHLQFTPEEDMAVLSRCNHSIVTAGTFGWWSAWLAGGDVVYYKDFIQPSSPLYAGHVPSDYYPPHWIGLP